MQGRWYFLFLFINYFNESAARHQVCGSDVFKLIPSELHCVPSDYCFKSDDKKFQAAYLATKTAYRTARRWQEESRDDFKIAS